MTNPVKTYKIVQTPEVFMTKPTRTYKGQHYWSGTLKPHTRKDGTATTCSNGNRTAPSVANRSHSGARRERRSSSQTGAAKSTGGRGVA